MKRNIGLGLGRLFKSELEGSHIPGMGGMRRGGVAGGCYYQTHRFSDPVKSLVDEIRTKLVSEASPRGEGLMRGGRTLKMEGQVKTRG